MIFGVFFTINENLLPRWVAASATYLSCVSKSISNNLLNLLSICIELKRRKVFWLVKTTWHNSTWHTRKSFPSNNISSVSIQFDMTSYVTAVMYRVSPSYGIPSWYFIPMPGHFSLYDNAPMTSRFSGEAGPGSNSTQFVMGQGEDRHSEPCVSTLVINTCTSSHSYILFFDKLILSIAHA